MVVTSIFLTMEVWHVDHIMYEVMPLGGGAEV